MKGEFIRNESRFRNRITATAGTDSERGGQDVFPAEPGRYHLYVSYACPWAHRTLIYRMLKGLEDVISVSVVHPLMPRESWVFGAYPGATPDHVHGLDKLSQLYELVTPGYDGLVSVPVLYDKHRSAIVNNESSEIIRMLSGSHKSLNPSGILMSQAAGYPVSFFGVFELPVLLDKEPSMAQFFRGAHGTVWILLVLAVIGHAGAALHHHYTKKDNVLKRMSFGVQA